MRITLQPSYVLHRRPYRESSLLVEALSRDFGRIGLIARGARGSRRGRGPMLQPFRPLLLGWTGRGELPIVTDVEAAGRPPQLPQQHLPHAFYLNELLMVLLARNDPHDVLFAAYAEALRGLVEGDAETTLRRFEVSLLEALGLLPDLTLDARSGEPVEAGTRYRFELDRGPVRETEATRSPWVLSGATLQALEHGQFAREEQRREARRFMQTLLAHHLGGRALKSRELFRRPKQH